MKGSRTACCRCHRREHRSSMGVNPLDGFVQSCVAGSPRKAKTSLWSVTSCCSMLDNLESFAIKWNHLNE